VVPVRFWLAAAGLAVAFLAAGVFFATRGSLGEMDQYASVGSFLLALATIGGTALVAARNRAPANRPEPGGEEQTPGSRFRIDKIENVGQLTVGDNTTTHIHHGDPGAAPPEPRGSRRRRR
jgi:hypothetical protein